MAFRLPDLPYALDALEPHITARTLEHHHGMHHRTYVETLNELVAGGPFAGTPIEAVILATAGDAGAVKTFNNAAQSWNHALFWRSMRPRGGGGPAGALAAAVRESFGDLEGLKTAFMAAAADRFGSGWVWLVSGGDGLAVRSTPNAASPLLDGSRALIVCDLWEHAYYLDYQGRRADYVRAFLDELANWEFAEQRFLADRPSETNPD